MLNKVRWTSWGRSFLRSSLTKRLRGLLCDELPRSVACYSSDSDLARHRVPLQVLLVCAGLGVSTAWSATGPSLEVNRKGSEVSVSWGGKGILETADAANAAWKPIPAAQSPYQCQATGTAAFFRVRIPTFELRVSSAGAGTGSVASDPPGIQCGADCTEVFEQNTSVTLTASANQGSKFVSWGGDASGSGVCQIVMDSAKSITAIFEPDVPGGGLVNGDFEQGPLVGWYQEPGQLIYPAEELGILAVSGKYVAWLGYAADGRHVAAIGQSVTLPETWPLYLNFSLWLDSKEICDACCWDTFVLYIDGQRMVANPNLCHGNTGSEGWRGLSVHLSNLAGFTVYIYFEISAPGDEKLGSRAFLDNVFLSDTPW